MDDLIAIAEQFVHPGEIIDIREFGNGNINITFLVTTDNNDHKHFILQLINTQVFRKPELVMNNIRIATAHIAERLKRDLLVKGRRWEVPRVIMAKDGRDHWYDPDGSFWRAISFIEARSFRTIKDSVHAREVGYALGMFHTLLSDLPTDKLSDTLEGFHITPFYLQNYDRVLEIYGAGDSSDVKYCIRFVSERRDWAHVLENAKEEGRLQLRTIHGDPKVDNIMIDRATGKAIGIIDLDTVMTGLVHYDIGDCLRSGCNPVGEDTEQLDAIHFDTALCSAVLMGYLAMARDFFTENDFNYIYDSVRLISFELGLRFITDYLEGNVYFKVRHPGHNLVRALVQFRLCESIESQEKAIKDIIRDMR